MLYRKVALEEGECMNLASKRLQREEYWYKELIPMDSMITLGRQHFQERD